MNMTDPNAHDLIQRLAQFAEDAANGYLMVEPSNDGVGAVVALAAEARAYLAQPEPNPDLNPWREAVMDALVCNFILTEQNSNDPRKAVSDLIAWEHQLATDPLVASVPKPASDGPAVLDGREEQSTAPTDEELTELWSWSHGQDAGPWPTQQHCYARAVLARWGNHTPQLLPAEPGSADHIVNDDGIPWHQTKNAMLWARAFTAIFPGMAHHEELMLTWFANAIEAGCTYEHWKINAERTPIPISERLPAEEDCDIEGRCWLCGKVEGDWRLMNPRKTGIPQLKYVFSHFLPHWAIPVPQKEP